MSFTVFEKYVIKQFESVSLQLKNIQKTLEELKKTTFLPNNHSEIPFEVPISNIDRLIEVDENLSNNQMFDNVVSISSMNNKYKLIEW